MDSIEIADIWKFCSSPVAIPNTIKKNPPTNNIIPVEMSTSTGRSAFDEYKDPTDQLSAAITNAIIPTNSNFALGVKEFYKLCCQRRKYQYDKAYRTYNNPKYSKFLEAFSI